MSTKSVRRSVILSMAVAAMGTAIGFSEPAQAATDTWTNQAATGNWSTSPTDKNWSILGVQSAYTDGDNVIFSDSAGAVNTSIDLIGSLNPGSTTVADPTLNYTFFGAGTISNGGLTKSGGGTLTLAGSNQNLYVGNTTIMAGELIDSMANLAPASNLIYPGSPLLMYGGTLDVTNGLSSSIQGFGATFLDAGGASITVGGLSANQVELTTILRTQGATANFTIGAGDQILDGNANAYGVGIKGTLGGYATVNGTDWASVIGGDVIALPAPGYTANVWAPGVNTELDLPGGPATGATQSLRFNASGNKLLPLNSGASITSGGILMTPNAGASSDAIVGGTLTSGNTEHDLIVNQYDPLGQVILATTIIDSPIPTGLTKSGPGSVILANPNTYTGPTTINAGILSTSALAVGGAPSNLGASTNLASNLVLNGGTLQFNGSSAGSTDRSFSVGPNGGTLDGSGSTPLNFNNSLAVAYPEDAPTTLTLTGSFGTPSAGNLLSLSMGDPDVAGTFKASVVKSGTGTWIVTNSNNTYSGGTTINAGVLKIQDSFSATSSALGTGPVTVNNGGTLGGGGAPASYVYGPTTVNGGGSIIPGDATNVTFQNGLTLNSGAGLLYNLNTPGIANEGPTGGNDLITSTNNATISTNIPVTIDPQTNFGAGTYPLIQYGTLTNNSSGFTGWSVDMQAAPPGLGAGQYQTYQFVNDVSNKSVDLNVAVTSVTPTLPTGASTTIVQQANTAINNSTVNNPVVNIQGGAGGNTGAGGPGNTGFYLARGPQTGAKAFSFGWIPLAVQLAPGTPYFVSSGIQVGDPNQTGIPVSPNAPYTTNPPFNPPGTGQVSIGGNVVGAIYPAGTNPPSAAPDDWLPAYYLAPLIVVSDPPATPVPTYYGETYANPNGLTDIYLADQVGGEDELPGMLDADAAGVDDKFDYQGSFLSLVQSDFPSITDLSQLSDAQWSEFDGSYGWDPSNDIAWSIDDVPNADYTVVGILPEPGSLSLLGIACAGLMARRRRAKGI